MREIINGFTVQNVYDTVVFAQPCIGVRNLGGRIAGTKYATMAYTEGSDSASWSESHKVRLSPDWSLQLDSMKSESLVIANQNVAVNTFPGLVHTARHTMGVGCTRSR